MNHIETNVEIKQTEAADGMGRVLIKGSGDLASGIALRLHRAGFRILMTDIAVPTTVRRTVAFSPAVYQGRMQVEDVTGVLCDSVKVAETEIQKGNIAIMVDEKAECIHEFQPDVVVDAILAKKNLGTTMDMAETVIALGPGFTAGVDAHLVIETQRGHNLGRVLTEGTAAPNTGIPGVIAGYVKERVIHAPAAGILQNKSKIGDLVEKGQTIAMIGDVPVTATLTGVLRGLIRDGYPVTEGFKIADIDPRESEQKNCYTISDKARCIAGGVLEGILMRNRGSFIWKK